MMREFTVQRGALLGMALGLAMIVQPWSSLLFTAGFPFTLAAILAYNISGWMSGERAGKSRDDEIKRREASQ
jgi:hypothetical protein